jgi:methyl-accepting chemotaxis protein
VSIALQELIETSDTSVEHLGAALLRVQEIAGQVQLVSNRATLVALHAVTLEARLPREQRGGEELSHELRQLTADVRGASQRADELAAEVERNTRAAGERMRRLRDAVAVQIEAPPAPPAPAVAPAASSERARMAAAEPVARLLERVREMIQDATQKGERLSAAGERASRAAERLLRRLEDQTRDLEGLMVRLTPGGELPDPALVGQEETESRMAARLRLLEAAGETAAEAADTPAEPGASATEAPADSESNDAEAREELP